jgi:hypothetical protein
MLYVIYIHITYSLTASINIEYRFHFVWMLFERKFVDVKIYIIWRHARITRTHTWSTTPLSCFRRAHTIFITLIVSTHPHRRQCLRVCCRGHLSRETNIKFQWLPITHIVYNTIVNIIILYEIILQPNLVRVLIK